MRSVSLRLVSLFCFLTVLYPALGLARTAPVETVSGRVLVNGLPVEEDETITSGDVITTPMDDSGYVDVMLSENHKVRFENPDVQFDSLDETVQINMKGGLLFSASGDEVERGDFRIKTRQGIAGIRGTKFFLKSTPEETYICVCEGTVWFQREGVLSDILGSELNVPEGYDAHIYTDRDLPDPQRSPQMVERTWKVFETMGYEIPEKYR